MNTMIKTVLSLCVVFVVLGAGLVPVINAINEETEVITETITYGDNPLDSYTDIIASAQRGDVSAKYTVERGDFTASTSTFTPNSTGDYIKVASLAAEALTFYAEKVNGGMYVGAGSSTMAAELSSYSYPYQLTYQGQTWKLALNSSNNQIVEVTVDDVTDGAYAILPYDVTYDVPTPTVYQNNTVQTSTVSSQYGTMSGTTFTADPNGDWLSIPLYVLNNGTGTYKVADGATYYAPDSTGSLAAFTAPSTTGVNSAITIAFTQDTSISSATVYTMTVTSTDTDLPNLIIPREISGTVLTDIYATFAAHYKNTGYIITTSGDLLTAGSNTSGLLGNGDSTVTTRYTYAKAASDVVSIALGGYTAFYINNSGELYGVGSYAYGGLGNGISTGDVTYSFIKLADNVEKVMTSGAFSSAYIDTNGDLYVTGNLPSKPTSWSKIASNVVDCQLKYPWAGGDEGLVYLTANGDLYAYGTSTNGFGLPNTTYSSPTLITSGVSDYVFKNSNLFYITTGGDLYGAGLNTNGQLGNNSTTDSKNSFVQIASNVQKFRFSSIQSSNAFCAYISTGGDLYMWGYNVRGNLGLNHTNAVLSPTLTATNVQDVWLASDTVYAYTIYLDSDNTYRTGIVTSNSRSQTWVSLGSDVDELIVYPVSSYFESISAPYPVFGLDSANRLYGLGMGNALGQETNYEHGTWYGPTYQSTSIIWTNNTDSISVSDARGSISGTTFTPSASGDMLQIPLRNLAQYTYYIGDNATYYAPNESDALTAFTAPDSTGVNTAISPTFTDMGSTYYNTLNSLTATVADSDLKAVVIPFAATYTVPVSTHYTYNFVGSSSEYAFSESSTGAYIKIPGAVLADSNTYYLDDASTYYALNADSELSAFTTPSTVGVTGITLSFAVDASLTDVYELTGSGAEYVIIPRVYDGSRTNGVDVLEVTFTPVRGNVANGTFTESVTGSYVKVFAANLAHATYRIGDERVYYVAENDTVEATKTVPDTAGIPGASLTLTADTSNEGFYILTGTTENDDTAVLIPYTASYEKTETIVTERIPMLNVIPLIIILVGIVSVVGLLVRREF